MELSLSFAVMFLMSAWFCTHPLVTCLTLIGCASFVGLTSAFLVSSWLMYSVVLIFLGGMMVVFIYVSTLAGNDKILMKFSGLKVVVPLMSLTLMVGTTLMPSPYSKLLFMGHMYSNTPEIFWFMIAMLLGALFITVKLSESFKGALIKGY